jgi:hypothetical protein
MTSDDVTPTLTRTDRLVGGGDSRLTEEHSRASRLLQQCQTWAGPTRYHRFATALHLASLVVALAGLIYMDSHVWFGYDDFDFLFLRGLHSAAVSVWVPHNQHWSTIPILIYRAIFTFTALRTALPYSVVNIAAHVGLAHLLWRTMRLADVDPLVNAALVGVFLVLGSGASGTLRAFQIGFTGAVLLGWMFVLLENHEAPSHRRRAAAWTVSSLALMFSGVSITMVAVGGLVALMRRGWRAALLAIAPAFTIFAVWFLLVGHRHYSAGAPVRVIVLKLPSYVFAGLTATLSGTFGSTAIGPILLVAVVWWMARTQRPTAGALPAFAGVAGALLFFVINGFGRDYLGSSEATSDRYIAVAAALCLPAIGMALSALVRRTPRSARDDRPSDARFGRLNRPALAIVLVALLLAGVTNLQMLIGARNSFLRQSGQLERQVVAAAEIGTSAQTIPGSYPLDNPDSGGSHHVPNLSELLAVGRGALPTGVQPNPSDRLAAATYTQLGLTTADLYPIGGARITAVSAGAEVGPGRPGCFSVTAPSRPATVDLAVSSPTSIALHASADAKVIARLSLPGLVDSGPDFVMRSASRRNWFDVAASPASVVVTLPTGATFGPPC